jgi:hypothetical protein
MTWKGWPQKLLLQSAAIGLPCFFKIYMAKVGDYKGDVQTLLQERNAGISSLDFALCLGRIGGVSDMAGINGFMFSRRKDLPDDFWKFAICFTKQNASYGARVQAFRNWAQKHPEEWGDADCAGVVIALREVWLLCRGSRHLREPLSPVIRLR